MEDVFVAQRDEIKGLKDQLKTATSKISDLEAHVRRLERSLKCVKEEEDDGAPVQLVAKRNREAAFDDDDEPETSKKIKGEEEEDGDVSDAETVIYDPDQFPEDVDCSQC